MQALRSRALYAGVLLAVTLSAGPTHSQTAGASRQRSAGDAADTFDRASEEIGQAYYDGRYAVVIASVDRFMASRDTTLESVPLLFFKAESQYQLGQAGAAVQTYQLALNRVEKLANNVTQRQFVAAYFRLAQILRQQQRLDAAIAAAETALRLAPQAVDGQIFLGQLLAEGGRRELALELYRNQLASPLPVAEQRAVIGMKVDRLSTGRSGASIRPPDLTDAPIYPGLSIGVAAVNQLPAAISLADICVVLESSWRIGCDVLPPIEIAESLMLDPQRGQYDANAILTEVERRMSKTGRRPSHLLAITSGDLFAPQTNFVFSWQRANEHRSAGILSTSRFTDNMPDYYDPEIVATRRVMLQALSTTGSMLGLTRPTDPQCPMAYPSSFDEFQQKRLKLCRSEEEQRDRLLLRRGGQPGRFGRPRSDEVAQVYRKYFIE